MPQQKWRPIAMLVVRNYKLYLPICQASQRLAHKARGPQYNLPSGDWDIEYDSRTYRPPFSRVGSSFQSASEVRGGERSYF